MAKQPSDYCKMGKNHKYLGHFGKAKYLKMGHNDIEDVGSLGNAPGFLSGGDPSGQAQGPVQQSIPAPVQQQKPQATRSGDLGGTSAKDMDPGATTLDTFAKLRSALR